MSADQIALIVHGGAGSWRPGSDADAVDGVRQAVQVGRNILEQGGTALDAAMATVMRLEDNPIFNAGTGGVLNFDGQLELDACIMTVSPNGRPPQTGAVSALQRVKNPIHVARQVMEHTDHVMLTGEGALRFARVMGHGDHNPITPQRHADWLEKKALLMESASVSTLKLRTFLKSHPEYAGGTVGAVARDRFGNLCAATSTGGVTLKMPGRVGDTPLPGCGTFANRFAASSATGTGEFVIRSMGCRQIADFVERGMTMQQSVDAVLQQMGADFDADVGLIAIDAAGTPYANHRTRDMPHAWFQANGDIVARMRC